jgi:hypothetical protein
MKIRFLRIGCLTLLFAIVCSCAYNAGPSPRISSRKFGDIPKYHQTEKQITAMWGRPDDRSGPSTNVYSVYHVGNREVWIHFEASPPHYISWYRAGPPCFNAAHVIGHRRLSDLKFTYDLTYQQVAAVWGRPDSFAGSGVDYFVYTLNKRQVVWMAFDYRASNRLLVATLRDTRTGQGEHLIRQ